MTILAQYLTLFPPRLYKLGLGFRRWMSSSPSIWTFIAFDYTIASLSFFDMVYKWHFNFH